MYYEIKRIYRTFYGVLEETYNVVFINIVFAVLLMTLFLFMRYNKKARQ